MAVKKKATAPKVAAKLTDADLKGFAEELMAQIGPKPSNWEQIVEEAIKEFRKKQKEA